MVGSLERFPQSPKILATIFGQRNRSISSRQFFPPDLRCHAGNTDYSIRIFSDAGKQRSRNRSIHVGDGGASKVIGAGH
jgi:hypothetical protein